MSQAHPATRAQQPPRRRRRLRRQHCHRNRRWRKPALPPTGLPNSAKKRRGSSEVASAPSASPSLSSSSSPSVTAGTPRSSKVFAAFALANVPPRTSSSPPPIFKSTSSLSFGGRAWRATDSLPALAPPRRCRAPASASVAREGCSLSCKAPYLLTSARTASSSLLLADSPSASNENDWPSGTVVFVGRAPIAPHTFGRGASNKEPT
mmetsp:Transcript_18310/g.50213  ORF Transcript_18310/g.50213 Transcript_18310/m.50213 type:complete len:207 (-) Transcript_18310:12-632(-)